jgi:DUF1009 family protein
MPVMERVGLIAGKGDYPLILAQEARAAGVSLCVVALEGETAPEVVDLAMVHEWLRVGQLGRLSAFFRKNQVRQAIMAGQVTPGRLFDLKPDWRALLLLVKLKERNAEAIFGAIADFLAAEGVELLPATTFMDSYLADPGHLGGPKPGRHFEREMAFGWKIAKEVSRLDIGQTVVVRRGTVLAVEGFDGTDATIRRGGQLGKGEAVVVKVSKPGQDMRFDVPVLGPGTLEAAAEAGVKAVVCEAKKTLLLFPEKLRELASRNGITLWGCEPSD